MKLNTNRSFSKSFSTTRKVTDIRCCNGSASLPKVEYGQGEIVRSIPLTTACISFKGRYAVCFGAHQIAEIDLTNNKHVSHAANHASTISPD